MPTVTTLPGANTHYITLQTAVDMTSAYRQIKETMLTGSFQNMGTLPLSETFNRAALDAVLAQDDCEGIRIYYGWAYQKVHAILVGVTGGNKDIIPSAVQNSVNPEDDIIIEMSQRCPDICPPASPLNS